MKLSEVDYIEESTDSATEEYEDGANVDDNMVDFNLGNSVSERDAMLDHQIN